MEIKRAESLLDLFQVFFYALRRRIFLRTFSLLLAAAAVNFIILYMGIMSQTGSFNQISKFICLIFDLYFFIFLSYIMALQMNNHTVSGSFSGITEITAGLSENYGRLLLFMPILVLLGGIGIFLVILLSQLQNVPYAGTFVYAVLFFPLFLSVLIIIIAGLGTLFSLQYSPFKIADQDDPAGSLIEILRDLFFSLYHFWPQILFSNLISMALNLFLSLIIAALAILALAVIFSIGIYFSDLHFLVLVKSLPFNTELIIRLFENSFPVLQYYHKITVIPDYYRISSVLLSASLAVTGIFISVFPVNYLIISFYSQYNIIKRNIRNMAI
ncbi:MAG: hypothetical protein A2096_17225 [Spirochaetes bacterium GWF1_41_5]|nr:MAG: hypothetical protein A2096_17225 [Spirochaetes bacterium GWF1_41_5]HBE03145.1 hypothetical protein [Spirochaetia bacterium]